MANPNTVPQVSIVIPAYNHGAYLARAIESVLAQNYRNLELIVLDDGSTDDTPKVLARYGDRFHWETHVNMGQAATLNKGWRMACGEILGYLSADDWLLPGAVARMATALLARPGALVAYCDFQLVDPRGKPIRRVRAAQFSLEAMLLDLACPPGPGALFRRSAFERAGGWNPELRLMADFDFWLRLARYGEFIHVPEPLAAWRVHPSSQSFAAVSEERAGEPVRIIQAFFNFPALEPHVAALARRSLARAYLVCGQFHARSSRYQAAARSVIAACKAHPLVLLKPATWRLIANALISQPAHRLLWAARTRRKVR